MAEIMAFVVLSLPILAVLLIGIAAAFAARAAARRMEVPEKKWKAGILAVLIVILIPTWDEIVGRLYFHYLCATKGGGSVYERVKLPAEYWNVDGSPIFLDPKGNRVRSKLDDQYDVFKRTGGQEVSQLFRIKQYGYTVSERGTNRVLGKFTFFFYSGGWLQNTVGLNVKAVHCPTDQDVEGSFVRSIFPNKLD